jgi:hypothetical protein
MFMNQFLNTAKRVALRQILVLAFVLFTCFGLPVFGYSNVNLVAQAETIKTPEGIYYKGTPDASEIKNDQPIEQAQNKFQEAAENIKEKLNLNEPVPKATKKFLKDVEINVKKTVAPLTGESDDD